MFDGYNVLAPVYDALNDTVDYESWAVFVTDCFEKYALQPDVKQVLDLGCGTGSMTIELAKRGYDMIGLDLSEDMLSVAEKRARDAALRDVMFISGDMCSFELYGTVDAVVCCLDGINHLTAREDVDSCFAMVSRYLNEGGVFLFDVNTPHKFRTVYANNDYILEDEGVMCCWRNRLSKKGDVVDFYLTVFRENEDGSWSREDGVERERAYGRVALENSLKKAGLDLCGIFAGYGFESITEFTDRWYFVARKPQKAE